MSLVLLARSIPGSSNRLICSFRLVFAPVVSFAVLVSLRVLLSAMVVQTISIRPLSMTAASPLPDVVFRARLALLVPPGPMAQHSTALATRARGAGLSSTWARAILELAGDFQLTVRPVDSDATAAAIILALGQERFNAATLDYMHTPYCRVLAQVLASQQWVRWSGEETDPSLHTPPRLPPPPDSSTALVPASSGVSVRRASVTVAETDVPSDAPVAAGAVRRLAEAAGVAMNGVASAAHAAGSAALAAGASAAHAGARLDALEGDLARGVPVVAAAAARDAVLSAAPEISGLVDSVRREAAGQIEALRSEIANVRAGATPPPAPTTAAAAARAALPPDADMAPPRPPRTRSGSAAIRGAGAPSVPLGVVPPPARRGARAPSPPAGPAGGSRRPAASSDRSDSSDTESTEDMEQSDVADDDLEAVLAQVRAAREAGLPLAPPERSRHPPPGFDAFHPPAGTPRVTAWQFYARGAESVSFWGSAGVGTISMVTMAFELGWETHVVSRLSGTRAESAHTLLPAVVAAARSSASGGLDAQLQASLDREVSYLTTMARWGSNSAAAIQRLAEAELVPRRLRKQLQLVAAASSSSPAASRAALRAAGHDVPSEDRVAGAAASLTITGTADAADGPRRRPRRDRRQRDGAGGVSGAGAPTKGTPSPPNAGDPSKAPQSGGGRGGGAAQVRK